MIENKTIAVAGSGVMGLGIAQVAALNGNQTIIYDVSEDALVVAAKRLEKDLEKATAKGKISEEQKTKTTSLIVFSNNLKDLDRSALLIEAIPERLDLKLNFFAEIEALLNKDTIIASNTSSFSITVLGGKSRHPERFIGAHFFNPAHIMPLVEVVNTDFTSTQVSTWVQDTLRSWGKIVVTAKDTPGFIVNRVARPFYCEALRIVEEGIADVSTVDHAMKTLGGFRMGPFELMDLIGIDTNFSITCSMYESYFHEARYRPSLIQQTMVDSGRLGRKSGKGFYNYGENAVKSQPQEDEELLKKIFERILCCLINEAAETYYCGVASIEDIDLAVKKGVNYPQGLFEWGSEIGYGHCVEVLDSLFDFYHDPRYRVSAWLRNQS